MLVFVDRIRAALTEATGLPSDQIRVEQPRDAALGDFAFPCFPLAKVKRAAPPAIAAELAGELNANLPGIEAVATGPYINFRVDRTLLATTVVESILDQDSAFGTSQEGAGKTIVIDFSSPNIAKPMHVGHLRSTIIGASIQRMHDALGYKTVGVNHIGDWGSQFGKLCAAIARWGDELDLDNDPIPALLALYVRYHEEEEADPSLADEARAAFRELESGAEGKIRDTWKRLTELSLRELNKIYERLGVSFDLIRGESFYESMLDQTVERIESTGITSISEGALVVDLSEFDKKLPPCLLRKTDGTTLYATRDFAAVFHRWEEFAFERCLYVVAAQQKLHFRQMKIVLERMQLDWVERVEHIDFGMLRLGEGKMSTREGKIVFLEELLDRAVSEARTIVSEKNPDLAKSADVAEIVGIGAVIFHDLKKERIKDVVFDWNEVLSFEGETGPYVQYTHARLASILRKAEALGEGGAEADYSRLDEAAPILLALGRFPDVIRSAAQHCEPSEIAQYLLSLCRETSSWYSRERVLGQEPSLTAARLSLVRCAKLVIGKGLQLLGVVAPDEM